MQKSYATPTRGGKQTAQRGVIRQGDVNTRRSRLFVVRFTSLSNAVVGSLLPVAQVPWPDGDITTCGQVDKAKCQVLSLWFSFCPVLSKDDTTSWHCLFCI